MLLNVALNGTCWKRAKTPDYGHPFRGLGKCGSLAARRRAFRAGPCNSGSPIQNPSRRKKALNWLPEAKSVQANRNVR